MTAKKTKTSKPIKTVKAKTSKPTNKPRRKHRRTGLASSVTPPPKLKHMDYYYNLATGSTMVARKARIDEIRLKLLSWAERSDSINILYFCLEESISQDSFDGLADRHEALGKAKKVVNEIIAARREQGAIYSEINGKKVNSQEISRYQGMYCKRYKEFLKWKAQIANPVIAQQNQHFTIVMPNQGETVTVEAEPVTSTEKEKK